MLGIKPRLDYRYGLKDAYKSLKGVFNRDLKLVFLNDLFKHHRIFYTNHARTAIRLALDSFNLPKGSKIGVQAFNCYTVFAAIEKVGFFPVFIDVTDDLTIDLIDLSKKAPEIDALIVTHLFGFPADMESVGKIIKNVPIIEDCTHSFLSSIDERLTGTFGDISVFSFGKAKFPSVGNGGYALINNHQLLNSFEKNYKELNSPMFVTEILSIFKNVFLALLHVPLVYRYLTLKYLKKIDDSMDLSGKYVSPEAKVLKSNIGLLKQRLNNAQDEIHKKEKNYKEIIEAIKQLHIGEEITIKNGIKPNFFMLPILYKEDRNMVIKLFREHGIEIGTHFQNSLKWAKLFGYKAGSCPNTFKIASQILVFPTYYSSESLVRVFVEIKKIRNQ